MFLESNYIPQDKQSKATLSIYDVGVLIAQIGDKPIINQLPVRHLTSGMLQLVCYFAQGTHMARTGRSLFREDFYVVDNRIENPKLTNLFGPWNKRVTPFTMTEAIKAHLAPTASGFNIDNNRLCQEIAYQIVPKDYKQVMGALKNTKPYMEALDDPLKKLDKKSIKEYFESQIVSSTNIKDITIGV